MSRRYEVGVGCLLLAALLVAGFMAVQVGAIASWRRTIEVVVPMDDVAGLQQGSVVSVAGIEVGNVEELAVEGDHALVTLSIAADARLPRDVRVRVRARSLLGEKYVEISPLSTGGELLADGDVLARVPKQTEVDELIMAMGPLVEGLGESSFPQVAERLSAALEADPERLTRMLENADLTLQNAAQASAELPAAVAEARATLADARRLVDRLDTRAQEAEAVIAKADALMETASEAASDLPELSGDARAAIADVRAVIEATGDDLEHVLANLVEIDKTELRRLIREEGVLIRLKAKKVEPEGPGAAPP